MVKQLKLLAWDQKNGPLEILRDLTSEEVRSHLGFTGVFAEARNRLKLFKILAKNFDEWSRYLRSLLAVDFQDHQHAEDELNRLLLNYLTFAYTIREHFEVSYRQRFKKDDAKLKEYASFLNRLSEKSWAFAFFLDFRGYVQHRGLAVGRYNRSVSTTSVRIEVAADAEQLLRESREWGRSKLAVERGSIDLVDVLDEFHAQMLKSYGPFVAKTFFPELMPASVFYGKLTAEVKAKHPQAGMFFHEGEPVTGESGGRKTANLQLVLVPNDVFGELGIKVELRQSKTANAPTEGGQAQTSTR